MIRILLGEMVFFLLPFLTYAGYLILRQRNPARWDSWSKHISWLTLVGLACVGIALIFTGITAPRTTGAWVPAHMENGQLIPGRFK